MQEYQRNKLKGYIENSELVNINKDLKIRLSKDLLENYNNGSYNDRLNLMIEHVKLIDDLKIKYPGNAKPVFYLYVVPTNNFRELLNFPSFRNYTIGGKTVPSYDLDGFNSAYGMSENVLTTKEKSNIMNTVNNIHEFAHLVHSMFFNRDRFIDEGFAEALPLYTMDYESQFDEHRKMLQTLKEEQILSAQQLIELTDKGNFDMGVIIPNKSCAFDVSYISSYLFIRGCLETISSNYDLDKVQATQNFLEIVRESQYTKQWLVFDIANAIGLPQEELLHGKEIQLNVIKKLSNF